MKSKQILIIAGLGTVLYLLLKPKKPQTTTTASQKPDCSAVGKVNCQILDRSGKKVDWCCGKDYFNNTIER